MLAKTHGNEEIIERVAALDIGKAGLVCCIWLCKGRRAADDPAEQLYHIT